MSPTHPPHARRSRGRPGARVAVALVASLVGTLVSLAAAAPARAAAGPVLLSQGAAVTVSSSQDRVYFAPTSLVDGDLGTRWASAAADPQWVVLDLGAPAALDHVALTWEAAFAAQFRLQTSDDGVAWADVTPSTAGHVGAQTVALPAGTSARYVRLLGTQRATGYGYSLWELEVYGSWAAQTSACSPPAARQGWAATASSQEWAGTPASAALDGDRGTRWSSAFAEPQWWQVDLGVRRPVCRVALRWEAAYARTVAVQVSRDGAAWTEVAAVADGWGGRQLLDLPDVESRYVRLVLSDRVTGYGVSLWEVDVWTSDADVVRDAVVEVGTLGSSGVGVAVQQVTVPRAAGAGVSLVTASGAATSAVSAPGQGTYVLDADAGVVRFAPALGFAGAAAPVTVTVRDSWDRTPVGTYAPVVLAPPAPAVVPLASTGPAPGVQRVAVEVPVGGRLALVGAAGAEARSLSVVGEGTYEVDDDAPGIVFDPVSTFAGVGAGVTYRVVDAYGQAAEAAYRPAVTGSAGGGGGGGSSGGGGSGGGDGGSDGERGGGTTDVGDGEGVETSAGDGDGAAGMAVTAGAAGLGAMQDAVTEAIRPSGGRVSHLDGGVATAGGDAVTGARSGAGDVAGLAAGGAGADAAGASLGVGSRSAAPPSWALAALATTAVAAAAGAVGVGLRGRGRRGSV